MTPDDYLTSPRIAYLRFCREARERALLKGDTVSFWYWDQHIKQLTEGYSHG